MKTMVAQVGKRVLLCVCLVVPAGPISRGASGQSAAGRSSYGAVLDSNGVWQETEQQKEQRTAWWREGKFGMFIHWGLYSIPAGEWNGRKVALGRNGEWIMKFLKIPAAENRKFAEQFNPVKFDARAWVKLAKEAGMKYIVITAKHHDGFAMYHSKVSKYNIVDATPFKRDVLKELAGACREEGIRFCVYYSHSEDWDHPDSTGNDWDYPDEGKKDFERYLAEKSVPQFRELLTEYGPIGLAWFDRGISTVEQGKRFVRLVRELQPDCLVNGRVGNYKQELLGDYQCMGDNGMPASGVEELWETPQTLNRTWGYRKDDTDWKSSKEVIRRLVEIVSKGGNYLLNVGPTAEGIIPEASVSILREAGQWVSSNRESIYGTTASPFGELGWGRCTVKGERLFLHVFDWPKDGKLTVAGLKNGVKKAYLLADSNESELAITRKENVVTISVGQKDADAVDTVVVLEIKGRADVEPIVVKQGADSAVVLDCSTAITQGRAAKRFNRKGGIHVSRLSGPEDCVLWHFMVDRAGSYMVEVTYSAQKEWIGREYVVSVGQEQLGGRVQETGDWFEYKTFMVGTIPLGEAGRYVLRIRPMVSASDFLMYLKSVRLSPVGR